MKKLLGGHPELYSGINLKKVEDLSLEEFLKLMRLIFGTEAADLSSAQQHILRAFQCKSLTFENYNQIGAVCLTILQSTETYALPKETQEKCDSPTHQAGDGRTPKNHTYHVEAKAILDGIMANDLAMKSLEGFTEDLLTQLRDNKTMFALAVKRGLFRPIIPKKRIQLEILDEEPAERETLQRKMFRLWPPRSRENKLLIS